MVSPAFTVICFGLKVKLSICHLRVRRLRGAPRDDRKSDKPGAHTLRENFAHGHSALASQRGIDDGKPLFALLEGYACRAEHGAQLVVRHLHRPGDGAVPGAGCGKAVERAVWKVTLPSTFCMI